MKLLSLTTFLVLIGSAMCQLDYDDYFDSDVVISELEDFMPGIIGELDISVIQEAK